ncbi:zinc metalloproteinase-disintegrin-like NaMP [Centruroides sculpturatus]|uniref:zinc metalloproteinase-disintegrin-like NaMP n=1 Tax=Centruroides sculpturatus TaxID=218467 RepID=UPI000C6EDF23|nr:zinc metalloproteinase-disintegrin-like NaMP [Centruroides sculpturatus]
MIQLNKTCFFGSLIVTAAIALDIEINLDQKMDDLLSSLRSHHVVIPIAIDENRDFLGYNLRQSEKLSDAIYIYYKLKLEDKIYFFNLTKNRKLITGNYIKEVWDNNGRRIIEDADSKDCHYHGEVNDDEESFVALSICDGLGEEEEEEKKKVKVIQCYNSVSFIEHKVIIDLDKNSS